MYKLTHNFENRLYSTLLLLGGFLFSVNAISAQETGNSFLQGELSVQVEGMTFFRDNEYDSDISKGYTLPGAWLRPTLQYNPLENIHLEAGVSGLFYDGANKYPNYAYHDIAKWKGNQYQSGVHLLPWLRAEMKTGKFDFILGNIYGGTFHKFITPLYNKEQVLSADPETGAQILFNSGSFHSDIFANWQSFQFEEDTHQEAFTVGISSSVLPFKTKGWNNLSINLQTLIQHRGGELDITTDGVQTICNGSIGMSWDKQLPQKNFNHICIEADVLGCYQQKGELWDFKSGAAYNASASLTFLNDLHLQMGYFLAPKNFITIYGNPYFSTISLKYPDLKFTGNKATYFDFGYSHTWTDSYTFGANLEAFNTHPEGGRKEFVFSFGLYMIFKPKFLL